MDKITFLINKLQEELAEVSIELLLNNIEELQLEISDVLTIAHLLNKECNYNFNLHIPVKEIKSEANVDFNNHFNLVNLNIIKLCSKSLVFGHMHNKIKLEKMFDDFILFVSELKHLKLINENFQLSNEYLNYKVTKLNKFSPYNLVFYSYQAD